MDTNLFDWFVRFEGKVPHLYLDTVGLVTIGIGSLVQTSRECRQLPLIDRLTQEPASDLEKTNEYSKVSRQLPAQRSSYYSQYTHLVLPDSAIQALFEQKLRTFQSGLETLYPSYQTYPPPVRLALLDMAYNLGLYGLGRFKLLRQAVLANDWQAAALQSHRSTCRDERNQAVADLFRSA